MSLIARKRGTWSRPKRRRIGEYRIKALEFFGARCHWCGFDEHEKLLDVHHRDHNAQNNVLSNLMVLCVLCHARVTRLGQEPPSACQLPAA